MIELSKTVVGSHMWGMEHPDSDYDVAVIYLHQLDNVLDGTATYESWHSPQVIEDNSLIDVQGHEAKKVVDQLTKGNINFIQIVLSDVVLHSEPAFEELREILRANPAKNTYHSIRGMGIANFKDIESGRYSNLRMDNGADYRKKVNQVGRLLQFGTHLLTHGEYVFERIDLEHESELLPMIQELTLAYENSKLPETTDETVLRAWLANTRMHYSDW